MFEEEMKHGVKAATRVDAEKTLMPAREDLELALRIVDARLDEVMRQRQELTARRAELQSLLHRSDASRPKPAHTPGMLITACSEAVNAHPQGLKSAEVVAWLRQNRPDLKTNAIPAVLLRSVENGRLICDAQGRYRLTP